MKEEYLQIIKKHVYKQIIKEQPKAVEDYKAGSENSLNFLVGQVMRELHGEGNPNDILKELKEILGD